MTSKPLPPANEDPSVVEAREITATYRAAVDTVRADGALSALGKARLIDKEWQDWSSRIEALHERFWAGRRERALELEALVPIGPGIPEGTRPADAAVLHQAFAAAYERAGQAADRNTIRAAYDQAVRFGDVTSQRAVLTAALDRGVTEVFQQWSADDPVRADQMAELDRIRRTFSGLHQDARVAFQAFNGFGLIRRPAESVGRERLEAQAQ